MDWSSLFFTPEFQAKLQAMAVRRFGENVTAEEAVNFAIDALSEDNWHRCRSFTGRSQPQTFLYSVINNAYEDFARKRFGRIRPPVWLQERGEVWVQIWQAVCMERQLLPSVIDRFAQARSVEFIQQTITHIKAKMPWCGKSDETIPLEMYGDDEAPMYSHVPHDACATETAYRHRYETLVLLVHQVLLDEPSAWLEEPLTESVEEWVEAHQAQLARVREILALSDQEIIILRMVYQEGLKKSRVAQALGMASYEPGRIIKRALDKLKQALEEVGLNDVLATIQAFEEGVHK